MPALSTWSHWGPCEVVVLSSRVGKTPLVPWCYLSHQEKGGTCSIPVISSTKQSRVSFGVTLRRFDSLHPSNRLCSIHHYLTTESIQQGDIEMQQVNQEQRYDNKSANLLQTDLHQICKLYSADMVHQNILQN